MEGEEEWGFPRKYSLPNTEVADRPIQRQSGIRMEDRMTLDWVLIWTDDAETDEYVHPFFASILNHLAALTMGAAHDHAHDLRHDS